MQVYVSARTYMGGGAGQGVVCLTVQSCRDSHRSVSGIASCTKDAQACFCCQGLYVAVHG